MVDVSVIIVNYQTASLTIDCINSIFEKTHDINFQVIVVDNDSKDDSVSKLKDTFHDQITIIPSPINLGFGKGNNLGAKYATGEYLFLLNPDTYLLNNAIKELKDYLDVHQDVGVVGGNLYFPDLRPAPSYCTRFDYPEDERKNASWVNIVKRKVRNKRAAQSKSKINGFNFTAGAILVAYVFGADMMIRNNLFKETGGFDDEFFMYAEEEELSWRIKQMGYKIVNIPTAKIVHLEGASTSGAKGFNSKQFSMRMNGKLIYYKKCFGKKGMDTFYLSRCRQYRRLLVIARLRGKDIKNTATYKMLKNLEKEYQNIVNVQNVA